MVFAILKENDRQLTVGKIDKTGLVLPLEYNLLKELPLSGNSVSPIST